MAKKSLMLFLLAASVIGLYPAGVNPWGNLKKIYFYDSLHDEQAVRKNLAEMDFIQATRLEQKELVNRLLLLGDRYFFLRKYDLAAEVYQKILAVSPGSWTVYNRLEKIKRGDGGMLLSFRAAWKQFAAMRKNFKGSFLLVNSFLNILFYAGLLVFFLFTMFIFWKYFLLAVNDFVVNRVFPFFLKNLFWIGLLLIWPAVFLGGWGFYPFLIAGFLWVYMTGYEKAITKTVIVLLFVFSLILSFNQYLEKSAASESFRTVQKVFAGEAFDEKLARRFDSEMKALYAYYLYEHNQPAAALDVLNSIPPDHRSTLKFDLLGNIHFEAGNFRQSIQSYRDSLNLNRRDEVTLRNFTVALLKYDDPKTPGNVPVLPSGDRRCGGSIQSLHVQRNFRIDERFLWKRLLHSSEPRFPLVKFLQALLLGLLRVPVILLAALMALYIACPEKSVPFPWPERKLQPLQQDHQKILCRPVAYPLRRLLSALSDQGSHFFRSENHQGEGDQPQIQVEIHRVAGRVALYPRGLPEFPRKKQNLRLFRLALLSVFGFSLLASSLFRKYFGVAPLFLNYAGMAAFVLYFFINLFSIKGDDNGF